MTRENAVEQVMTMYRENPRQYIAMVFTYGKHLELRRMILEETKFLDSYFEAAGVGLKPVTRVWYFVNGVAEIRKCAYCGKPVVKNVFSLADGARPYCGPKCAGSSAGTVQKKMMKRMQTEQSLTARLKYDKFDDAASLMAEIDRRVIEVPEQAFSNLSTGLKYARHRAYLKSATSFLDPYFKKAGKKLMLSTRYFYASAGRKDILKCSVCGGPVVRNIRAKHAAPKYCSMRCVAADKELTEAKLRAKKLAYGADNSNNWKKAQQTRRSNNNGELWSESQRKKASMHCSLRKAGVRQKGREKKLALYGDENYTNRAQASRTYRERTGYDNPSQNPAVKAVKREKSNAKFGVSCPLATEGIRRRTKELMLEKYGCEHYTQSDEYRLYMEKFRKDKIALDSDYFRKILQKAIATSRKKWGSDFYSQSEARRAKYMDKDFVRSVTDKQLATRRRNGTFNASESERRIGEALDGKFGIGDVIRQYRDDSRYPFACDFYVASLDLFIEFNGTWTHGGHFFDPCSEDDLAKFAKWTALGSKSEFYRNAAYNWAVRDANKARTAADNGLRMLVFWTEKEAMDWIRNARVNKSDMSDVRGNE